ncbi:Uu.00g081770.m01.CDS01 [Anthostomella pinea]|uniref:Uu.00g081770.m01.CDS01 n=1 Tax=Anthostomella pinea TaxID=933095 RepID=A0AAI8YJC0_9PEZI|nr:Uu.00g081770.m01.CDS01 [Anthostomella pinea]
MAAKKDFEIAIVGGGIAGITLAIALLKHNIPVQVYEQGHAFSEIGAGVAFGPNAVRAMDYCDQSVRYAFDEVATRNQWASKQTVYFDFLDGMAKTKPKVDRDILFTLENQVGANSVHRADFMEQMAKLVPKDLAHFRKRLEDVTEDAGTGRLRMKFTDGTTAEADAVIGCDGIKSRTRQLIVGEDHPSAKPHYSQKYAYRAVMPMQRAIEAVGGERAENACLWMGEKAHVLTFPINHGKTFNLVAIVTDDKEWPDVTHLTLPAHKDEALKDYSHFGDSVLKNLEMVDDNVDRWALFDTCDHPVPTFYKGRLCISGDAAHATTPHHGAGAGFCIEDSAVLTHLLTDERVTAPGDLESVFAAFNANRKERDQWLVADSRRTGEIYEFNTEDPGKDLTKIEKELRESFGKVWDYDLETALETAREDLGSRLGKK